MIIVYLSITLAIVALIYLGISAFRTFKGIQPAMQSMSSTAADLQEKMEGIKKETDQLKRKTGGFQQDIQENKQAVLDVIDNVKWSGEEIKSLWKWARMVPNPKKVETAELSPEVERVVEGVSDLIAKWKKWRR
ncbi:MAG TPA: DUF948 domain-containing protein [Bacillales bacterium]|nr:DUF948 domain-containing protein [Bacillales bacterium]